MRKPDLPEGSFIRYRHRGEYEYAQIVRCANPDGSMEWGFKIGYLPELKDGVPVQTVVWKGKGDDQWIEPRGKPVAYVQPATPEDQLRQAVRAESQQRVKAFASPLGVDVTGLTMGAAIDKMANSKAFKDLLRQIGIPEEDL